MMKIGHISLATLSFDKDILSFPFLYPIEIQIVLQTKTFRREMLTFCHTNLATLSFVINHLNIRFRNDFVFLFLFWIRWSFQIVPQK